MLALKSVKEILSFMGLLLEPNVSLINHYLKILLITIPLLALLFPLVAYFVFNAGNLVDATDVFYVIAATFLCLTQYWFLAAQPRSLVRLIAELQTLIDEREHDSTVFHVFNTVERTVFSYTKRMKAFVSFSSTICLILPFVYSSFHFLIGKYKSEDWYLPYKMLVPFDDKTFLGYSAAYIIQISGSAVICAIIYSINSFFFGICYYFKALLNDLCSIYEEINELHKKQSTEKAKKPKVSIDDDCKKRRLLGKFVMYHNKIFDFIKHFGELMCGTIFITFAISITWICTSLFQIHSHVQTVNYLLLQSIMTTSAIVLIIFIFCYFGHMVTSDSEMIAHNVYSARWYQFPIHLQKSSILIIGRSNDPFYLTAFKMYRCSLGSFTGIINSAFQIFMLFRSVNAK